MKAKVSIWFGKFHNQAALEKFMEVDYSEARDNEPWMTSDFGRDFRITYYDEDLIEVCFQENGLDNDLLAQLSYADTFMDKLICNDPSFNSVVAIYELDYEQQHDKIAKSPFFEFIGSFDYFFKK